MKRLFTSIRVLCPFGVTEPDVSVIRDFLVSIPLTTSLLLRLVFWAFYWLPPLILFRFRTVAGLVPADQERYLEWWENHRLAIVREAFMSLKTVSLLAQVGKEWAPK